MVKTLSTLFILAALTAPSWADWGVAVGYEFVYDYDTLYSNLISREHRDGADLDDWIERGSATVTASPVFPNGVRLAGWATDWTYDYEEEYFDIALASAIYYFEIPPQARYIKIKIFYRGEGERVFDEIDEIAGKVWIRNYERERLRRRYEGDDTLYGDTFLLRANRRSETIRIPAEDHVKNGIMEMHVVVEDGMLLDVDYIVVESYRWLPEVRVVRRYYRIYDWWPWRRYTYIYFYDGPWFYPTDYGYYICWTYPAYDRFYLSLRFSYRERLGRYYARYPRYYWYRRWSEIYGYGPDPTVVISVRRSGGGARARLRRWSPEDERIRREYVIVRTVPNRERSRLAEIRKRIRERITGYRAREVSSEATVTPARARIRTTKPVDTRRQTSPTPVRIRTRRSSATGVRIIRPRTEVRIRTEPSRTITRPKEESPRRSSIRSRITSRRREPPKVSSSSSSKEDEDKDDEEKKEESSSSRRSRIRSRVRR